MKLKSFKFNFFTYLYLLTTSKTKLDHLFYLWDKLICEDDETFMHYFIISFLEYHSDLITTADFSQIPSIISQLTIKSIEMIDKIYENAKKIRAVTPYSFRLFINQLDVFKPFSKRHKELFEHYQPENLMCLPILPSEIFYIAYNKIVSCPDKNCRYFKNLFDYENQIICGDENLNYNKQQPNNFFEEEEKELNKIDFIENQERINLKKDGLYQNSFNENSKSNVQYITNGKNVLKFRK
jgi:hypothetical protein